MAYSAFKPRSISRRSSKLSLSALAESGNSGTSASATRGISIRRDRSDWARRVPPVELQALW